GSIGLPACVIIQSAYNLRRQRGSEHRLMSAPVKLGRAGQSEKLIFVRYAPNASYTVCHNELSRSAICYLMRPQDTARTRSSTTLCGFLFAQAHGHSGAAWSAFCKAAETIGTTRQAMSASPQKRTLFAFTPAASSWQKHPWRLRAQK